MMIYKRPTSQFYWCRFSVGGKQIRRSTGHAQKRQAEQWARALRNSCRRDYVAAEGTLAVVAELDYARAQQLDLADSRVPTLRLQWAAIHRHIGCHTSCALIPHTRLDEFVRQRQAEGVTNSTIRREVATLMRGLRLAAKRGWVLQMPDAPEIGRHTPGTARAGHEHSLSTLQAWMQEIPAGEARTLALVALLTGLRRYELSRLKMSWVQPGGLLSVPAAHAKTRRARTIGLPLPALTAMRSLAEAEQVEHDAELFRTMEHRRAWATACTAIGYDRHVTLRDLRTTHSSVAARLSGDPAAVQAQLGHADLRTTAIYMRTTLDQQRKAAQCVSQALMSATALLPGEQQHAAQDDKPLVPDVPPQDAVGT